MNLTYPISINSTSWNIRLAGASTYIQEEKNFSFSFDFISNIIEKYTIKKLTTQIVQETERIQGILAQSELDTSTDLRESSKQNGIKVHSSLVKLLDKFEKIEDISLEEIRNRSIRELHIATLAFVEILKQLEMQLRKFLWPSDNEILFTYDELKELYQNQHLSD